MIKVGVSACVVGQKVRFDGGHKQSKFVVQQLAGTFELVNFCPEVGMGMPVPRPTIHLREMQGDIRLVDSRDPTIDHSDKVPVYFDSVADRLAQLDGYVVAAKSPTCGMERIKVYTQDGDVLHRKGMGVYTAKLRERFPTLPIEEDGRLNDQGIRESFLARVFAHHHFRTQVLAQPSMKNLVDFHSRYKFLVLAYHPEMYRELGRLVANHEKQPLDALLQDYLKLMMTAMARSASRKKHTNVLMHLQGFLKKSLSTEDKQELTQQIEHYRLGHIPLMAPLTLLKHHIQRHTNDYLKRQVYLQPYPLELGAGV